MKAVFDSNDLYMHGVCILNPYDTPWSLRSFKNAEKAEEALDNLFPQWREHCPGFSLSGATFAVVPHGSPLPFPSTQEEARDEDVSPDPVD